VIASELDGRGRYHLQLQQEQSDLDAGASRLHHASVRFELPTDWSADTTHPDLLGAALLLSLRPFVGRSLTLPRAVSRRLATAVFDHLGVAVAPIDEGLAPRRPPGDGRPGLAFSGGVDSCATLLVLGPESCCVFLDRVRPQGDERPSSYRPEAATHALARAGQLGHQAVSVASDVEFLGERIGFPVHDSSSVESSGVPVVLLADLLGLDVVSWGSLVETCYGVGYGRFVDHRTHPVHTAWREVLAAAGLPVMLPLVGVSEVGATRLVVGSEWEGVAQSCVRGLPGRPCMNCLKCVRRTLVRSAVTGEWPDVARLEQLLLVREFRRRLYVQPVPLTDVYRYALGRAEVRLDLVQLLRRRWAVRDGCAAYQERWYAPSAAVWPEGDLARRVAEVLDDRLGRMRGGGRAALRRWDPVAAEEGEHERAFALALARHLDLLAGDRPQEALVPGRDLQREVGLGAAAEGMR
jgi:hypothetical protein